MVSEVKEGRVRASGSARGDVCVKRGFVKLKSHGGVVGIYETNCKSWSCNACSRKLKSLVVDRLEYGMKLISGQLFFITLTFKTVGVTRRSAVSVEKAYRRWCELMRSEYPKLVWFKTVEWTKRRQAHLHLVVGGLPPKRRSQSSCVGPNDNRGKVLEKECRLEEECLDHTVSAKWWKATKDSYVTSSEGIVGPKGAANYMSKYVSKDLDVWAKMALAGFGRRWSCSQNWPRYEKLELAATTQDKWATVAYSRYRPQMRYEHEFYPEGEPEDPAFQRVGSDRAMVFAQLKKARKLTAFGRKMKNASNHEATGGVPGSGKRR